MVRSPTDATYVLSHHPGCPGGALLVRDEQEFLARPGDRISHRSSAHFRPKLPTTRCGCAGPAPRRQRRLGELSDAVPIKDAGGKEEGYAGYSYKQNWSAGDWLVTVETRDGREIGRRRFAVSEDPDVAAEDHGLVTASNEAAAGFRRRGRLGAAP